MRKLDVGLLKKRIESRINADVNNKTVGGALVQVMQDDKVLYMGAFGSITPDGTDIVPHDTMFRMASMTKPITAAAILILAGKGKLKIDDPIDNYLPQYSDMNIGKVTESGNIMITGKAQGKIRILHLLTHSSGVGTLSLGDLTYAEMNSEQKSTLKGIVNYFSQMPLAFEPFTREFYSPFVAFDILARIVEIVSGLKYDEFLKKELFTPLGMKDTTFTPTDEQWGRMIAMHDYKDGKSLQHSMPKGCVFGNLPTTCFCGGAGLASTLDDYSAFAQMLVHSGRVGNLQIIAPELVNAMRTPQLPHHVMPGPQVWGLGVRVITDDSYGRLPTGSFGWSGAYGTHFWVDPENRISAVYLKNSLYDGGSGAVTAAHFEEDVTGSFQK